MTRYISKIDRRTALKWLSAAAATLLAAPTMARTATYVKTPKGYGTDPDMLNPSSPWDRIMSDRQLQTAAVLCDIILPEDAPHPSPSQIGVPDFINEWVSSPYAQTEEDRQVVLDGLDWLDVAARQWAGQDFVAAPADVQQAIVADIAKPGANSSDDAHHDFFRRFRTLTLGGYYTTPAGFKDIGYIGNVPMTRFPGPDDDMKARLDKRLKAIGL